jgi:RadC-like JAB domain
LSTVSLDSRQHEPSDPRKPSLSSLAISSELPMTTKSTSGSSSSTRRTNYLMHTLVSTGTQSASLVHPREVLGPALRVGAASLILVRNHPSGDPTPSPEDLRLTQQLVDGAELLDLRLHDHVIIGNGTERWVSLAQIGAL